MTAPPSISQTWFYDREQSLCRHFSLYGLIETGDGEVTW